MNEKVWIVKVVSADPPAVSLTGLPLNDVARSNDDDMDKVTLPEKLSMLDNNTLAVPVLPWGIERKLGSVETLKSGPVTRISMKRLCTMFPLVAVTSSSKKVDGGVPRGAVTVSRAVANVCVALSVTLNGLTADWSDEKVVVVRMIVPENPPREESVRVEFADWPALRLMNKLLDERVKSGPVTLSCT